jgi:hypothetical protein
LLNFIPILLYSRYLPCNFSGPFWAGAILGQFLERTHNIIIESYTKDEKEENPLVKLSNIESKVEEVNEERKVEKKEEEEKINKKKKKGKNKL